MKDCAACTTRYPMDLDACPHCGSTDYAEDGHSVTRRLPLYVTVSCADCGRGPWQLRLALRMTGLIELPSLFCASCGSRVQVPWPPVEDDMPKITKSGGPSNARDAASSPDASASAPLAGAEAGQGHPTSADVAEFLQSEPSLSEVLPDVPAEAETGDAAAAENAPEAVDYDGMTLAELRALAAERDVPSYGTKAQITERLREADGA